MADGRVEILSPNVFIIELLKSEKYMARGEVRSPAFPSTAKMIFNCVVQLDEAFEITLSLYSTITFYQTCTIWPVSLTSRNHTHSTGTLFQETGFFFLHRYTWTKLHSSPRSKTPKFIVTESERASVCVCVSKATNGMHLGLMVQ